MAAVVGILDLAWAAGTSESGPRADLAGVGRAVLSGAASEGRKKAAAEASCWGALLLPGVAGQALPYAGAPVEGSAHAVGGLAILRISGSPRGGSGVQ